MENTPSMRDVLFAYDRLAEAKEVLYEAQEETIEAEFDVECARFTAIALGETPGKNAEEREAKLRVALTELYHRLHGTERRLRAAKHAYDLAEVGVKSIAQRLRVWELSHRSSEDA